MAYRAGLLNPRWRFWASPPERSLVSRPFAFRGDYIIWRYAPNKDTHRQAAAPGRTRPPRRARPQPVVVLERGRDRAVRTDRPRPVDSDRPQPGPPARRGRSGPSG